jgi:hypothetical protein
MRTLWRLIARVGSRRSRASGQNMGEFDSGTQAKLVFALSEACRKLPQHGGDHETRKYVAKRLIDKARSGETTDRELHAVARQALLELKTKRLKGGLVHRGQPTHSRGV